MEHTTRSEWSLRAAAAYICHSPSTTSALAKLDEEIAVGAEARDADEPSGRNATSSLSVLDVVILRVLSEMEANRPVRRDSGDERTRRHRARVRAAVEALRASGPPARGMGSKALLLVYGETARIAQAEYEVLELIQRTASDQAVLVLPVGRWLSDLTDGSPMTTGAV